MSSKTYNVRNKKQTPQSEPIPGEVMVENNAGGYTYQLDPFNQLERFLILGTEGGTYYVGERKLTKENANVVSACLKQDHKRTVDTIVEISDKGRAFKNDPALFALALACTEGTDKERSYAASHLDKVARIGTHLFHFVDYLDGMRGYGRAIRRALSNWYLNKSDEQLSFQLAKYQQRDGWAHGDIISLAHIKADNAVKQNLFRWAMAKEYDERELVGLVSTLEKMKQAKTESEVASLLSNTKAPLEVVPTEYRKSAQIWSAVLPNLGLTALIRNLGNMGAAGELAQGRFDTIQFIVSALSDAGAIRKARIHPLQALVAYATYSQGEGYRGSNTWPVVPQVKDALNELVYKAFGNVESTGKRIYLGLDVSGSMSSPLSGIQQLSCAEGAAVMAMQIARTEPNYIVKGFSEGSGGWSRNTTMRDLGITPNLSLQEVLARTRTQTFGGTDCALPMLDALSNGYLVDAFIIITDNETWAGNIHPMQALRQYRDKTGIPAKLIVIGMTSTGFTIADPEDSNCLDVVGFDANTPNAITEFMKW